MSHRSYRSTEPDPVELEPSEPSLQNNQDSLRYDLPDQPQEEEPSKVQGFFGVVPWSIKLSPGKVAPLADISTLDAGTSVAFLPTFHRIYLMGSISYVACMHLFHICMHDHAHPEPHSRWKNFPQPPPRWRLPPCSTRNLQLHPITLHHVCSNIHFYSCLTLALSMQFAVLFWPTPISAYRRLTTRR